MLMKTEKPTRRLAFYVEGSERVLKKIKKREVLASSRPRGFSMPVGIILFFVFVVHKLCRGIPTYLLSILLKLLIQELNGLFDYLLTGTYLIT